MISFIIPAHNEEAWIGRSISAIRHAMKVLDTAHEVIVVDDGSTDATSSIALENNARVLRVEHRQISATRNAGARAASGDILFFVDADTLVSREVVESGLRRISEGAVGGGCVPRFEGVLPLWWRLAYPFFVLGVRLFSQPGGSCLFATRSSFEAMGGFNEAHFAAEDAVFASALKRHGRFVVLSEPVITSGRNLRAHSFWSIASLLTRLALLGPNGFPNRKGLELWYRPLREKTQQSRDDQ